MLDFEETVNMLRTLSKTEGDTLTSKNIALYILWETQERKSRKQTVERLLNVNISKEEMFCIGKSGNRV